MRTVNLPVPTRQELSKWVAVACGILLLVYVCYLVREIWLPLGLAFLLAMILDPVVDRMEARRWSRARASIFIFGSFLFISIGLAVLAFPYVLEQLKSLQKGFERYFPDPSHAGLLASFRRLG